MRKGIAAVESSIKSSSGGTSGRYLSYFSLGDGETKILRFLTDADDIITTKFYEFVVDANDKFQTFVMAPDLYADDPNWHGEDWVVKYGGKVRNYGTKQLEDPKAKERTVAIAVEREEVAVEVNGKKVLKTQDKVVEIEIEDKDGKKRTHLARNFFLVKQAGGNFWNTLVGYYHEFGSLCDRDYKITRAGNDKNTSYRIIPKSEDPDFDLKELQARYGYGTGKDVDGNDIAEEERYLYVTQTLQEWVENAASEERIKAALLGTMAANTAETRPAPSWAGGEPDEPQGEAPVAAAPAEASSDMAALRERLARHK